MTNHHKPSKEELQAGMNASLEKLKTIPTAPPTPSAPPTPPTPSVPQTPPTPPANIEPPTPQTPPTPPADPNTPPVPPAQPVDWEKKAKASARDAQVIDYKNKEITKAYGEAATLPEPTNEDMAKVFPKWEDMTETEQMLAKQSQHTKIKFEFVEKAIAKFKDVDQWNEQVDQFVTDPKTLIAHPELEGKVDDFRDYASKKEYRGVPLDVLISAFNGERLKNLPEPKKGEMFPQGQGGPVEPPKPQDDKIGPDEARALMKSNYPEYKRLLIAGKIRNL